MFTPKSRLSVLRFLLVFTWYMKSNPNSLLFLKKMSKLTVPDAFLPATVLKKLVFCDIIPVMRDIL